MASYGSNQGDDADEFTDAIEHQAKHSSLGQKAAELKKDAKRKSKHLVRSIISRKEDDSEHDDPTDQIKHDPAFNPSRLASSGRRTAGGATDKLLDTTAAVGRAIINPKATAKKKAASKIATHDRPYLSHEADVEYIEAHDTLRELQSSNNASDEDAESSMADARGHIGRLENARDARKVAWTTSRHIDRVSVIESEAPISPDPKDFYSTHPQSGKKNFDWPAYTYATNRYLLKRLAIQGMGEIDVRPQQTFDKDVCIKYIERILIATSPWQSWFLNLRSIYRYDDPKKTLKWAAIWFVIWWADFVMTFVFAWTVFIVVKNKLAPIKAEQLDDSYSRARNIDQKAYRFNELIHRHGSGNWLDPLMEEAGPVVQMQLSDFADFLEILGNFYDWRNPMRTWGTLFWYCTAIATGVLSPTGFSMKILWMFCLLSFFLGRPIASRHPQYRHTVNALKWIFWEIPTDAEWSMSYLRRRAQETREKLLEKRVEQDYNDLQEKNKPGQQGPRILIDDASDKDSFRSAASSRDSLDAPPWSSDTDDEVPSLDPNTALQSFYARYKSLECRLLILPNGLLLRHASPLKSNKRPVRFIHWQDIREMRKFNDSTAVKMFSTEGLELRVADHGGNGTQPDNERDDNDDDSDDDDDNNNDNDSELPTGPVEQAFPPTRHEFKSSHKRKSPHEPCRLVRISGLRNRDFVFNSIIGFSGLSFQVLPPLAPGGRSKRAGDDAGHVDTTDSEDEMEADGEATGVGGIKAKVRRAKEKVLRKGRSDAEEKVEDERGVREGAPAAKYDSYQTFREKGFWDGFFA